MLHHDSFAATARTTSSGMPHLIAAHWRISSVVPEKPPVTYPVRRLYVSAVKPHLSVWPLRKRLSSAALGR